MAIHLAFESRDSSPCMQGTRAGWNGHNFGTYKVISYPLTGEKKFVLNLSTNERLFQGLMYICRYRALNFINC